MKKFPSVRLDENLEKPQKAPPQKNHAAAPFLPYPNPDKPESGFCLNAQDIVIKCLILPFIRRQRIGQEISLLMMAGRTGRGRLFSLENISAVCTDPFACVPISKKFSLFQHFRNFGKPKLMGVFHLCNQ